MMSQHTYNVIMDGRGNGDISQLMRDDGMPVLWNDPDFQNWNAAQQPPFALSQAQQIIQTLKAMDYPTWQANVTPAQKDRILFELMKRSLSGGVV